MIKVACLGAGYFSQFHLDGWQRIDGTTVVGVADQNIERANATGAPAFDNLEKMLHGVRPDILDIIVPPIGHATAIRSGLKYTPKVIICQKPFCTSLEEATAVAQEAEQQGVLLVVHENFRFQPWFRAIKNSISAGDIGEPLQATFRLRPGDGQGPDAYLERQPYFRDMPRLLIHETGVHFVDTFRYLFGDPTAVYADLRQVNPVIKGEDAGFVIFDHANGVRCVLDGNRNLDHAAENMRCTMGEGLIEGTGGTLRLLGDGSVHLRKFGTVRERQILPSNTSQNFGGDCTFHLQSHVVNSLTNGFPLENQATNYLTVIDIEQAIYRSAEINSKVKLTSHGNRAE